jgi:predicted acetyltransferase
MVQQLIDMRERSNLPEGFVPATELWLIDREGFIGRTIIRHKLNDRLRVLGGHIGYWIRPACRRKGYGTFAMATALEEANRLGLEKVLVTCDADNLASRKIIEKGGGVLEGAPAQESPANKLRYWIDVPVSQRSWQRSHLG